MSREDAEDALRILFAEERQGRHAFVGKAVPQHVFDGVASAIYKPSPSSLEWKWAMAVKAHDYVGASRLLAKTVTKAKGNRWRSRMPPEGKA